MIAVSVLNGAQGGSRTHKTLILSQVPMPIRLLGHMMGRDGVERVPANGSWSTVSPATTYGISSHMVLLSGVEPARPVYKTGAKIPFRV